MGPQPSKDTPAVQARRREQQDRIVAAAVTLFARHGFHRTSMQQLADEVGMSVGSLYQYVANKEAIIAEATRAMDRANAELLPQVTDAAGLDHLLRESFRHSAESPVEGVALNCEISAEASRNPVVAARLADQFETAGSLMADALRRADPDLSLREARLRAELLIAAQAGINALRASRVPATDLPELGRRFVDLLAPRPPDASPPEPADIAPTQPTPAGEPTRTDEEQS